MVRLSSQSDEIHPVFSHLYAFGVMMWIRHEVLLGFSTVSPLHVFSLFSPHRTITNYYFYIMPPFSPSVALAFVALASLLLYTYIQ